MSGRLQRHIDASLQEHFDKYKQVLILLGSRQVGKTTILKRIFPEAQYFLLDNQPTKTILETYDINAYRQLIKQSPEPVILDEIHLLSNPGRAVKIIYDQMPGIKLAITGSSSLRIKNRTSESLAGRKIDYHLYPLSFSEYLYQMGMESELNTRVSDIIAGLSERGSLHNFDLRIVTENVLAYGLYPTLVNNPSDDKYLLNLADSVVFQDLLDLQLIENRATAYSLLKLLAYQVGNLINYSEIANRLNVDPRTVRKYIEIFEQSFIIFRLYPYSTKKRDEIGKTPKIYFYDLGLRNALIDDFSSVSLRRDNGAIFENFIVGEFMKANSYFDLGYAINYWRLSQGSEMDLVLSRGNELVGIEIKYSHKERGSAFQNRYPHAKVGLITIQNFY